MRRLIKTSLLAVFSLLAAVKMDAQVDPHFTQYYVYPSWLNPALTGVFDGDYRIGGIYRTQWGSVSTPYQTQGVSVDFNTAKKLNIGVSALKQSAGDGGFNYTTAYASFNYTGVKFGAGDFKRLNFALQAGMIQRRFDPSKLTFGDQWNPVTGFNPGNATRDIISKPKNTAVDFGAGVLYFDAQPGKKSNFYAGFAASHITKPDDAFGATEGAKFPIRLTTHAGIRIAVNENFSITPNALYLRQGSASEKMIGAYGSFRGAPDLELLVGANYRFEDAVSPFVGFYYKNFVLGASYDINTSDLGKVVRSTSSFEISLTFIGRKKAKTPEEEFVCPRL